MTAHPTATWSVVARPVARDGDSVRLLRERELYRDDVEVQIRRDAKPVLCRALWLACPEISGPNADPVNGPRATRDAQGWLDNAWALGPLVAVQYGFEKYGRPLVDIQTGTGHSFSQWMVRERGWSPYLD